MLHLAPLFIKKNGIERLQCKTLARSRRDTGEESRIVVKLVWRMYTSALVSTGRGFSRGVAVDGLSPVVRETDTNQREGFDLAAGGW
jgi:hypothetical protein